MIIDPNSISAGKLADSGAEKTTAAAPSTGPGSFAHALGQSIDEVSKMQQDATDAVNDLATGKSDNVSGVMTAVEKADMAFKTLLSIRSKLLEAYDDIKGISV